ncbi:hypothetical protein Vadar_015654 [Vaccinium darrowii]|uniref:Uncharacterized protein n=1 Tax=Vaccinium darrowii TaxID=229202 RepID=A0ACB7ZCV7_9ERIC|nr:hypothetical protein Vadar_015654 [Vaccinium darrowii]
MSDYLPCEALINILIRLPAKSLLKFRCVCKSWLSLISSPDFTSAHLCPTTTKPSLLLRHFSVTPKCREIYSLSSDDNDDFTTLRDLNCPFKTRSGFFHRVVGCCNGVVCLSDDCFGYTYTIILWNPAIRRHVTLPKPNICFDDYGPYMHSLGFGFDPKTSNPKIVRIVYLEEARRGQGYRQYAVPPKVEVFALSTGLWKTIKGCKIGYHMDEFFWSSVFVNGRVHWTAYSGGKTTGYHNVVLVFDMGSEVFREVKLPEKLVGVSPLDLAVVGYKDSISIFQYDGRGPYCCRGFTVWAMNKYGVEESWSKLFTGSLNGGVSTILGFRKSGEVVVAKWDGKLVSCQPGRIKKIGIRGGKDSFYLGTYAESLILLDAGKCDQTEDSVSSDGVDDSPDNASVVRSLEKNSLMHYLFAGHALSY